MENIGPIIILIVGIGGVGIALGMYISSQIKCHIRKNINMKNLKKYENGESKREK